MSLWNRLALGIPCAWLLAMLLRLTLAPVSLELAPSSQRILILTIPQFVLFFPLRGLSRGVAEELELRERIRTGYQSDTGISYMYGEMSGMGFADGTDALAEDYLLVVLSRHHHRYLLAAPRVPVQPVDGPTYMLATNVPNHHWSEQPAGVSSSRQLGRFTRWTSQCL
jgi:hypothetical protein